MVIAVPTLIRIWLIVVAAMSLAGCELVGGIFKAGVYTGVIVVVLVIALIAFGAMKMRG